MSQVGLFMRQRLACTSRFVCFVFRLPPSPSFLVPFRRPRKRLPAETGALPSPCHLQMPNLDSAAWASLIGMLMSFGYSFLCLGMSIWQLATCEPLLPLLSLPCGSRPLQPAALASAVAPSCLPAWDAGGWQACRGPASCLLPPCVRRCAPDAARPCLPRPWSLFQMARPPRVPPATPPASSAMPS